MDLKLFVDPGRLRGLSREEFLDAAAESCRKVSKASGLRISLAKDRSDSQIEMAGGAMRSGILAYCYFPSGDCGDRLACRFNSGVQWSRPLFVDTLSHEMGHGFGMPHTNDKRDIMFPSIIQGRQLNGEYGPHYSIPQMVARYGDPAESIPLPPDLPDSGGWTWTEVLKWLVWLGGVLGSGLTGHRFGVASGRKAAMVESTGG